MSCYQCGSNGHKKRDCPKKAAKIKCYECGNFGHYKNDCPVVIEKAKVAIEQKKKESNEKWIHEVLPDVHKKLTNKEEIVVFLQGIEKSDKNYGYFLTQFGVVTITVKDKIVSFKLSNNVVNDRRWMCYELTIDKFLEFIETKGLGSRLYYAKKKGGVERLVHVLHKNDIVKAVYWDRKKYGCDYYHNDVKIMSEWDERGMESKIYNKGLICRLYDNYQNNGSNVMEDIKEIKIDIIFE